MGFAAKAWLSFLLVLQMICFAVQLVFYLVPFAWLGFAIWGPWGFWTDLELGAALLAAWWVIEMVLAAIIGGISMALEAHVSGTGEGSLPNVRE